MNVENNIPEHWLSTKEITIHSSVTIETIRNWIRKEAIPFHKIGKLWKYKISEVDAWVTSSQAKED